ncbi:hypothetical protein [Halobellus rufus]|uniref:hypothetical protein n=1 Tax=Halobellus rufus TaxID=1448860 RepID=UPI00067971CD|nr:hypothetical protein [Halobellus rufus]
MESTALQSIRASAFLYPLGVWVVMAVLAVANGIFRELVLIPRTGEYPGHVVSTLLLVAAILAVSGLYFANAPVDYGRGELLLVGVGWTLLTVGFEFLVGHVEGTPVSETVGQYDVFAGQVWILVPLTLLLAPLLFGWLLQN